MQIEEKQLKSLQVETQSGQVLGQVIDYVLETDTGIIEKYYVKSKIPITGLFKDKLIINRTQIIRFTEDEIIVDDNVIKVTETKKGTLPSPEKLEEPFISETMDN